MNKKSLIGLLSVGVIASAGIATSAFASTSSPSATSTKNTHQRHQGYQKDRSQLGEIAKLLGVNVQTLQSDLKAGQSIAEVAQAKGISESTLISDLQSKLKTHLDTSVQNGKLTSSQEQQRLSNAAAQIQKLVEQKGPLNHGHNRNIHRTKSGVPLNEVAKILGVNVQSMQADLKSGKSIADVAQTKGITEDTLISDLKSQLQTQLDKAVQNGKLTSAQEQQRLSNFSTNVKKFLEHKGTFTHQHHSKSTN